MSPLVMKRVVAILACLGAAGCAAAHERTSAPRTPIEADAAPSPQDGDEDCMLELYAYSSVVNLAKQLGSDSDVLGDALSDLRQQLVDCLTSPPAEVVPVHQRGA